MYESISIPAAVGNARGVFNLRANATVFACISASAEFVVRPDNGHQELLMNTGRGFGAPAGGFGRPPQRWNNLTFYNSTGTIITAQIYVGNEPFVPAATTATVATTITTSGKDAPTYSKGTACPANATTAFTGLDGALVRKQFAVFNAEPASGGVNITVRAANGTDGFEVPPQSGFTVGAGGLISVIVPSGAQPAKVFEVFYSA